MYDDWGEDSQIVKARVKALFPDVSDNALMSLQDAEQFYQEGLQAKGHYTIGLDIARYGQDESVMAIYQGGNLVDLFVFEKKNTRQIAGLAVAKQAELEAKMIVVDDIGVGGGVTDSIAEAFHSRKDVNVIGFIGSSRASQATKYANIQSECWYQLASSIKASKTKSAVQDDVLEGQLTSFKVIYTPDGRIRVQWPEKKEDRMTSDSKSPDRAYATMLAWFGDRLLRIGMAQESESLQRQDDDRGATLGRGILKRDF